MVRQTDLIGADRAEVFVVPNEVGIHIHSDR